MISEGPTQAVSKKLLFPSSSTFGGFKKRDDKTKARWMILICLIVVSSYFLPLYHIPKIIFAFLLSPSNKSFQYKIVLMLPILITVIYRFRNVNKDLTVILLQSFPPKQRNPLLNSNLLHLPRQPQQRHHLPTLRSLFPLQLFRKTSPLQK